MKNMVTHKCVINEAHSLRSKFALLAWIWLIFGATVYGRTIRMAPEKLRATYLLPNDSSDKDTDGKILKNATSTSSPSSTAKDISRNNLTDLESSTIFDFKRTTKAQIHKSSTDDDKLISASSSFSTENSIDHKTSEEISSTSSNTSLREFTSTSTATISSNDTVIRTDSQEPDSNDLRHKKINTNSITIIGKETTVEIVGISETVSATDGIDVNESTIPNNDAHKDDEFSITTHTTTTHQFTDSMNSIITSAEATDGSTETEVNNLTTQDTSPETSESLNERINEVTVNTNQVETSSIWPTEVADVSHRDSVTKSSITPETATIATKNILGFSKHETTGVAIGSLIAVSVLATCMIHIAKKRKEKNYQMKRQLKLNLLHYSDSDSDE